jgi:hypothetical protein
MQSTFRHKADGANVTQWLRRIRGAVGMGLTWAAGWAVFGILIGVTSRVFPDLPFWDAFFRVFDAPLPALAVPGFFGGALFSVVLGVAGRNRRFHELSLPRFTGWGATGGLLLSLVPAAMVSIGLATFNDGTMLGLWQLTAVISVPLTVLSGASAAGSLLLARRAEGVAETDDDRADVKTLPQQPAPEINTPQRDREKRRL